MTTTRCSCPAARRRTRRVPEGGWRINVWNNDIVGQGGVMTTVIDLQKWDENFYTGKVGGQGFLERQLQQGKLANGTTLSYAFGLTVERVSWVAARRARRQQRRLPHDHLALPDRAHERRRVMQSE